MRKKDNHVMTGIMMTNTKTTILKLAICFLLISCNQYKRPDGIKFDKNEWSIGGDGVWIDYTYTGKRNIVISDLNSGQPYDIRVATISAAGIGGWSNIVTQKAL